MKKETFVGLLKILEDYKKKSTKFGEAVSNAYREAGLDKDFTSPYAYEFPYATLADEIVGVIAKDFENKRYPVEIVEDFINWWMWECDFGKETYMDIPTMQEADEGKKATTKYMAEVTLSNGKTYIAKTAARLYDLLITDKQLHQEEK